MLRSEERSLIERAARGDQGAAASLIRHHQQSLYAYMMRMSGRPDVAEDIVQEAFVRVLTNLDRFDFRYRFSTWLFTIARRLYLNAVAKHRPAYDTDMVGAWKGADAAPEAPVEADEQQVVWRDALQAALLSLPADQREVVILFHQHDWPIALIAQHLDMPEGTVKSHLHRGRKRLRTYIETTPTPDDSFVEHNA
ncbi:MAG: sigma-70 family RNA polymerase sigma factor [Phycisphaerales bacterium]